MFRYQANREEIKGKGYEDEEIEEESDVREVEEGEGIRKKKRRNKRGEEDQGMEKKEERKKMKRRTKLKIE